MLKAFYFPGYIFELRQGLIHSNQDKLVFPLRMTLIEGLQNLEIVKSLCRRNRKF